ncbi:MAG TPA: TIGR02996 domain-containing protein [Gemmataceae bacterium]|nr:TIGR02996 domain-containing protein [Gemmataceae bacterium]
MPADYDRQQRALLDAVWDDYDNDAPRLAYADWLDSIGDPADSARAEHIRLCVRFPQPRYKDGANQEAFRRRSELERKYQSAWLAGLPTRFDTGRANAIRGMYEQSIYATPQELLADGEQNFRRSPPDVAFQIHLRLPYGKKAVTATRPDWIALLGKPWWDRVLSLNCQGHGLGPEEADVIASNRAFRRLRYLSLPRCPVGDVGVEALAASAHLGQLQTLDLSSAGLTGRGAVALAGRANMPELRDIYLGGNDGIDAAGWDALRTAVGTAGTVFSGPRRFGVTFGPGTAIHADEDIPF